MSSKRAKLTADKARERITSLEESIEAREQKLEQLKARLARSSSPESKLLAAQERLERRLELEREQVQKLRRLLARRAQDAPGDADQEAGEFFSSEEIDDLHRSFEEVRQDVSQMKIRLESTDFPRDMPARLNSVEERINRREEVASDLYTQIMGLQNSLEQERQTVRKLSRRIREQDQNLDALREAVEDSVVATVDLAERIEELEENINGEPGEPATTETESAVQSEVEALKQQVSELEEKLASVDQKLEEMAESAGGSDATEIVMDALNDFDSRLESLESWSKSFEARVLESIREAVTQTPPEATTPVEPPAVSEPVAGSATYATEAPHDVVIIPADGERSRWVPAKFCSKGSRGRLVASWVPANFRSARKQDSAEFS